MDRRINLRHLRWRLRNLWLRFEPILTHEASLMGLLLLVAVLIDTPIGYFTVLVMGIILLIR